MVQEAALRVRLSDPVDFTVAEGTAITKGALLKLTDPLTAAASDGAGDVCAGIAARDKVASDGHTRLAVFQSGIFDMYASGAITAGFPVMSAGVNNMVKAITTGAAVSGAAVIGYALETASDGEQIQVKLRL